MHKTTIHIPKDKESIYGSVPDWIVMLGVFTILYSEAESAFIFSIFIHFSLPCRQLQMKWGDPL